MSPLNRGPLLGPRMPPAGMRPPPLPRFGGRLPMPVPGMPPRMPPPMGPMFGPMRQRMLPPRPGGMMRPGGPPPPLFGPRARGVPPLMPPMMSPRGMGPRGLPIRPGPRGLLPPQGLAHMRPRFPMGNGNVKGKAIGNPKKVSKLEELELKKPWMTDEIRSEIQKKNKLYAKAKKNKDAKEWDEFKDLRNKVTRMIRDAKNDYLAKHPEQAHIYQDDAEEPYDQRDENYVSSEDETCDYCEVCDREFPTAVLFEQHKATHTTCGIDGCSFSAHPKLVEKHISMQHCTGLYSRIKDLSAPEDIQKWIAERKKKYPTKANIQQKEAEQTEKKERGEIIEAKIAKSKPLDQPVRERKRRLRKRKNQCTKAKAEPVAELYHGMRPFAGTANLRQETNESDAEIDLDQESTCVASSDLVLNISDEEERSAEQSEVTPFSEPPSTAHQSNEIASCPVLASLVADYGSDSTDDEGPTEIAIKKVKLETPAEETSQPGSSVAESAENLETNVPKICNTKTDSVKNSTSSRNERNFPSTENKSSERKRENVAGTDKRRNNKRLMLLQRLLSRSIQHERNIICQCIKYIADNNFLE